MTPSLPSISAPSTKPPFQRVDPVVYVLLGLMALAVVLGFCLNGEWRAFFANSREGMLMALVGVLAHVGVESRSARASAWVLVGVLLVSLVVFNMALVALVYTGGAAEKSISLDSLSLVPTRILASVMAASMMAALTALLPLFKSYRRIYTVITGNEEWTSVRVMALGGVVAITLLLFVPLLAVGEAPLLVLIKKDFAFSADVLEGARDSASLLRGETYSLTWNLLAATLAVGFGVRRNWRECLERLGLVCLSPRQIGLALGLTALVFVLSEGVDFVANHFWSLYAWPTTEGKAFDDMFKALSSPVGAIVIGVTAGLGEEVLVRGMLQPRRNKSTFSRFCRLPMASVATKKQCYFHC